MELVARNCAPCSDAGDAMGVVGLVIGSTGAIAGTGAAEHGPWEGTKAWVWGEWKRVWSEEREAGRRPTWERIRREHPYLPTTHELNHPEEYGRDLPIHGHDAGAMVKLGQQLQEWAEEVVGSDVVGTVPSGGKA